MKIKQLLLYFLGIVLLVFGNRDLWDELKDFYQEKERKKKLLHVNDAVVDRFETQTLAYDPVSKRLKNPSHYFQLIGLGNINFKATRKGTSRIESDNDEDATSSQ